VKPRLAVLTLLVALALAQASPTSAGSRDDYTKNDWPVQTILRPLTLAPKMTELSGDTFVVTIGEGRFLDPLALAPDLRVAATRRLTLTMIHDFGFCLNATGCGTVYNDIGLESTTSLIYRGNAQLALRIGVHFPRFNRLFAGARGGFTARLRWRRIALLLEPTIYLGVYGRGPDEDYTSSDALGRKELLEAPATLQLQVSSRGLIFVTSGLSGRLSGLGDNHVIPLGFGGAFAINHRVDFGAELRFDNAFGTEGDLQTGAKERTLFLRSALRF